MYKRWSWLVAGILSCALLVGSCWDAMGASVDLQTYKDPDGKFAVGLPSDWSRKSVDGFNVAVYMGSVSIGIMDVGKADNDSEPVDLVDKIIREFKADDKMFPRLRTIMTPSVDTSANLEICHARVSFVKDGQETASDVFVVATPGGKARNVMITRLKASEQDDYRTLFDKVVHSFVLYDGQSYVVTPSVSESKEVVIVRESGRDYRVYNDTKRRIRINLPAEWKEKTFENFFMAVSDGTAVIGVMEVEDAARHMSTMGMLRAVIEKMEQDREGYPGFRVLEEPSKVMDFRTGTAHARFVHQQSGSERISTDIFVLGDEEGNSRYVLMAFASDSEYDSYKRLFTSVAGSVLLDGSAVEPVRVESKEEAAESADIPMIHEDEKPEVKIEKAATPPATTPSSGRVEPLYWIRNDSEILRNGQKLVGDEGIGDACVSSDGKQIAYSRNKSEIVLANISTGKRTRVYYAKTDVTLSGSKMSEETTVYPVGFGANNRSLYVIYQAHSVFSGGNRLMQIGLNDGKMTVVDKGVASAAVSRGGDLLIYKPGTMHFFGKGGETWDKEPSIRSLFVNGVGFTQEGKPFYYGSDFVYIVDPKGGETRISFSGQSLNSQPVVIGETVISDCGGKLIWNKPGQPLKQVLPGENRSPFK